MAQSSKILFLLLVSALYAGCSTHRFATPYVLINNGFTVDPILVALNMDGEVLFQRTSCTGTAQSPTLHLTPGQQLRLRGAVERLRKLPGEEPEVYRRPCSGDERPLKVGIYESSDVHRWWSACISTVDESFDRLPPPFQEILRVVREIPEHSYNPLLVLH